MKVSKDILRKKLSEKGLKVTPQRISILEAVYNLHNHPTADQIMEYIHKSHPNIATGTVYKVLETLVENRLIKKVKTDADVMRYDGVVEPHHHLYSTGGDLIEDYTDRELDDLLIKYFTSKKITGFKIEEIVLQIRGTYDKG
jgi:Fur family transcriptional regulator, peroxide stress response regulator